MEHVSCPAKPPRCGGTFRWMGKFYPSIPEHNSVEQVVCGKHIAHYHIISVKEGRRRMMVLPLSKHQKSDSLSVAGCNPFLSPTLMQNLLPRFSQTWPFPCAYGHPQNKDINKVGFSSKANPQDNIHCSYGNYALKCSSYMETCKEHRVYFFPSFITQVSAKN